MKKYSKQAKKKHIEEGKSLGGNPTLTQKSAQGSIKTREELAKVAKVSHDTIMKVKEIKKKATEKQIQLRQQLMHR